MNDRTVPSLSPVGLNWPKNHLALNTPIWILQPPLPEWLAPDPALSEIPFPPALELQGVQRIPTDARAGWRYRDRPYHPPGAPLGPDVDLLHRTAAGRMQETSRRRPNRKDDGSGDIERLLGRAYGLVERYRWELDINAITLDELDPLEFANFVASLKPALAPKTWSETKAATLALLRGLPHERTDLAVGLIESDDTLDAHEAKSRPRSRGKVVEPHRRVPREHFDRIIAELSGSGLAVRQWLRDWLVATIHTGVLPMNWSTTTVEVWSPPGRPRRCFLHVVGLESASSPEPFARSLDISSLSAAAFDCVDSMTRRAHHWALEGKYDYQQKRVTQALYELCSDLFPRLHRPYTLYDVCAQFRANMKAIHEPGDAAALIGDIVDRPAKKYTKSRRAWQDVEIAEPPRADSWLIGLMSRRIEYWSRREEARRMRRNARLTRGGHQPN